MDEQKRDVMHPWSPGDEAKAGQNDAEIYNQPMDLEKGIKHQSDQFKEDIRHLRDDNVTPESQSVEP
jgi:hypothetical protein